MTPTITSPEIRAESAHAAATPALGAGAFGNGRARAACFGECRPKRGQCIVYRGVERPGQQRFIATCRTPEETFPLFDPLVPAPCAAPAADSEGGEAD